MVSVNLAIGPSCFVRCVGCYNHFGKTHRQGGLVSASELLQFVSLAQLAGVDQTTISGGDPLSHPELLAILDRICKLGLRVKLDTVGTALLGDAEKIFFGEGFTPGVRIDDIAPFVDTLGLPIDGATEVTRSRFRTGRPNLLCEVLTTAVAAKERNMKVCINTVASRQNIDELPKIFDLVIGIGADEWQIFEFQPIGPLGSKNAHLFALDAGQFDEAMEFLRASVKPSGVRIEPKSATQRRGIYFMVDDAGMAWIPSATGRGRTIIGHIMRDQEVVLNRLRIHVAANAASSLGVIAAVG